MPNIFEQIAAEEQKKPQNVFENIASEEPELVQQKPDSAKAFLKGATKEVSTFPRKISELTMGGPVVQFLSKILGVKAQPSIISQATQPLENLLSEFLEKKSPMTAATRPFEEYGARYAQQAPFNPITALLTAGGGQLTKELGGGPILQAITELGLGGLTQFGKNIAIKGFTPPEDLKDLFKFGKTMGMSDEEITPLMQSESKIKWLSTLSQKGKRANEALKGTKEALGSVFESIAESPEARKQLTPNQALKFANNVKQITSKMPVELREKLQKDAFELAKNGFKGSELMNFWKDINYQISQGNKELGLLKEPIGNALKDISPKLEESFVKTNNLYSRYYDIVRALKPSIYTEIEKGGKALGLLYSIMFFNPKALAAAGFYQGAKSLARETLINPKFQGLTKKLISALNVKNMRSANMVFQRMNDMIREKDSKIADELEKVNFEDLIKD